MNLNNTLLVLLLQLFLNYVIAFYLPQRFKLLYQILSYAIVVLAVLAAPLSLLFSILTNLSLADNLSIGIIGPVYTIFMPLIFIVVQFVFNTFILQQVLKRNGR